MTPTDVIDDLEKLREAVAQIAGGDAIASKHLQDAYQSIQTAIDSLTSFEEMESEEMDE